MPPYLQISPGRIVTSQVEISNAGSLKFAQSNVPSDTGHYCLRTNIICWLTKLKHGTFVNRLAMNPEEGVLNSLNDKSLCLLLCCIVLLWVWKCLGILVSSGARSDRKTDELIEIKTHFAGSLKFCISKKETMLLRRSAICLATPKFAYHPEKLQGPV